MKKVLAIVAAVALVVLAVALWWLLSSLDGIVKGVIEREGSRALGTAVRVGSVHIELEAGRGTVRDLRVANPEGFSSEPALRVGEIVLTLRPAAVTASPRVIDEVRLTEPQVLFEMNASGGANLEVLRRRAAQASEGEAEPAPEADAAEATPLVIRKLDVEQGRIVADLTALDQGRRELTLPPLHMRDLGAPGGAAPGRIGAEVVQRLLTQAAATVAADRVTGELEKKIDEGLGEAGKAAKGVLRSLLGQDPPEE